MSRLANTFMAIACALALAGCTFLPAHVSQTDSGRAAFEQGDYDRAVVDARMALMAQPSYEPALALLAQAYRKSVGTHTERIAAAKNVLDWDTVVFEFRSLAEVDRLARPIVMRSPGQAGVSDLLVDRTDEFNLALGLAAETHYQAGVILGDEAGKAKKREAARELSKAMGYISPYKDAQALADSAREAGTENVALVPFEDSAASGTDRQIFEGVRGEFEATPRRFVFVRFVPGASPQADLAVRGRVTGVSTEVSPITDTYVHSRTRIIEDDSGKQRHLKTESRDRSRTTTVQITLGVSVIDVATGREIRSETLSAEASEKQSWHEEIDSADDDAQLTRALGDLLVTLLGGEPRGPGPADTLAQTRQAGADVAGKARSWLGAYFESI